VSANSTKCARLRSRVEGKTDPELGNWDGKLVVSCCWSKIDITDDGGILMTLLGILVLGPRHHEYGLRLSTSAVGLSRLSRTKLSACALPHPNSIAVAILIIYRAARMLHFPASKVTPTTYDTQNAMIPAIHRSHSMNLQSRVLRTPPTVPRTAAQPYQGTTLHTDS
jgi:hypothetical protein